MMNVPFREYAFFKLHVSKPNSQDIIREAYICAYSVFRVNGARMLSYGGFLVNLLHI